MAIVLSRQALPTLDRQKYASAEGVRKAGAARMSRNAENGPFRRGIHRNSSNNERDHNRRTSPGRLYPGGYAAGLVRSDFNRAEVQGIATRAHLDVYRPGLSLGTTLSGAGR